MIDFFQKLRAHLKPLYFGILSYFVPSSVQACAVCFSGNQETLNAYYGTAIVLSILPLAMVGGIVYWVYKKYKHVPAADIQEHS